MPKLLPAKAQLVDNTSTERPKFPLLPVGRYRIKLTNVESGMSKKGKPMWTWHFKTVSFLDGPSTSEHEGKELRFWTVIEDEQLWNLAKAFQAFDAPSDIDTDDLIGDEIVGDVTHDEFIDRSGKPQTRHTLNDLFSLKEGTKPEVYEMVPGGSDEDPGF